MTLQIRPARPGEEGVVLSFIRKLADYEKLAHEVTATEADESRTTLSVASSTSTTGVVAKTAPAVDPMGCVATRNFAAGPWLTWMSWVSTSS